MVSCTDCKAGKRKFLPENYLFCILNTSITIEWALKTCPFALSKAAIVMRILLQSPQTCRYSGEKSEMHVHIKETLLWKRLCASSYLFCNRKRDTAFMEEKNGSNLLQACIGGHDIFRFLKSIIFFLPRIDESQTSNINKNSIRWTESLCMYVT